MKEKEQIRVKVAGFVFSIVSSWDNLGCQLAEIDRSFVSDSKPAVPIYARYDGVPRFSLRDSDLVFDSEAAWRLYRIDGRNAIVLGASASGSPPYRIALFDDGLRQVEVLATPPFWLLIAIVLPWRVMCLAADRSTKGISWIRTGR